MSTIDDIRRANPQVAKDLASAKKAVTTIDRLREAGIAKGRAPLIGPHAGRYGPLPHSKRRDAASFKTTFRA